MLRSLSARLTFLYTLLFVLLLLVAFKIVDYSLETYLLNSIDEDFLTDGTECSHIYRESGIKGVVQEIRLETMGSAKKQLFMRLYSPDLKVVESSDMEHWDDLPDHSQINERHREESFKTLQLGSYSKEVRIFFQDLGDGYLLQFGKSLDENKHLLEKFRRTFYLAFSIMLLSGIPLGLYIAKKSLAGVRNVQHGADYICRGDLSQRITYTGGCEEIWHLTRSFNQMQDQIQTLIMELRDVTNNVAHDLRSPVTRMRGLAETTLTGDQSLEDYRDLAGVVVEESDRLVSMINVMLEIAETDAGLRSLDEDEVDMRKMILDVTELYSSVALDKKIELSADISESNISLRGDKSRLQRALANILDNALKFTPADGTVKVHAYVADQHICVTVTDDGPGVPTSELPNLFDRFYRGDQSRSTPGSGLGLSLVDSIVRAHGGRIKAGNVQPHGLCIEASFPANRV